MLSCEIYPCGTSIQRIRCGRKRVFEVLWLGGGKAEPNTMDRCFLQWPSYVSLLISQSVRTRYLLRRLVFLFGKGEWLICGLKYKRRLQPWDNCKRPKFGGYLPHPGNHLTPSVELTTWYLVAPLSLLQPRRQNVSSSC